MEGQETGVVVAGPACQVWASEEVLTEDVVFCDRVVSRVQKIDDSFHVFRVDGVWDVENWEQSRISNDRVRVLVCQLEFSRNSLGFQISPDGACICGRDRGTGSTACARVPRRYRSIDVE